MPGKPVGTILPQKQKTGNSPTGEVWHASAYTPTAKLPHGLVPWVGPHPASTLQQHLLQGRR
jgi:hypothetical protein